MKDFHILADGYRIPKVGFGTYTLKGSEGVRRIEQALSAGYRLLDSAVNYENEGSVGQAVRNSGVPREEITVTSKLPGRFHSYDQALQTIQESVARMGLDYIDLYLIHWPNPIEDKYVDAWKALIDAQKAGLVRSIGVSNFLPEHIDHLEKETGVLPVVNQIEMHPYFNQKEQREYDRSKNIITESWSPIGRKGEFLTNDTILGLAEKYGKTPAQVVLRWHTHLGAVPIPKSGNYERQLQNLNSFDWSLEDSDIETINQLTKEDGRQANQDPAKYQEF